MQGIATAEDETIPARMWENQSTEEDEEVDIIGLEDTRDELGNGGVARLSTSPIVSFISSASSALSPSSSPSLASALPLLSSSIKPNHTIRSASEDDENEREEEAHEVKKVFDDNELPKECIKIITFFQELGPAAGQESITASAPLASPIDGNEEEVQMEKGQQESHEGEEKQDSISLSAVPPISSSTSISDLPPSSSSSHPIESVIPLLSSSSASFPRSADKNKQEGDESHEVNKS